MRPQLNKPSKRYLGGGWTEAESEETFESTNPVTGETVGEFTGLLRADPIIGSVSAMNAGEASVRIHTEDSSAGLLRGTVESIRSREVVGK